MDDYSKKLIVDRIILRALYALLPFGVVGVGFLFLSAYCVQWREPIRSDVCHEVGVALLVTAALTFAWDLLGKRAFTDEVLAKANMSRDLADAGIRIITPSFMDNRVSWGDLFKCSTKLDMWVAYASTWRNSHAQEIGKMLSRKNALLRVVMPDPGDQEVLGSLATRFGTDRDTVKQHIDEAIEGFKKLDKSQNVEIFLAPILPLFTMYLFSSTAVLAFYNHRMGRVPVPTFVSDEDGFLFPYLTAEFEDILARAKKIHPAP